MWKEARGEQEEPRSTGRGTTCANPENRQLPGEAARPREDEEQRRSEKNSSHYILENSWGGGGFHVDPELRLDQGVEV